MGGDGKVGLLLGLPHRLSPSPLPRRHFLSGMVLLSVSAEDVPPALRSQRWERPSWALRRRRSSSWWACGASGRWSGAPSAASHVAISPRPRRRFPLCLLSALGFGNSSRFEDATASLAADTSVLALEATAISETEDLSALEATRVDAT